MKKQRIYRCNKNIVLNKNNEDEKTLFKTLEDKNNEIIRNFYLYLKIIFQRIIKIKNNLNEELKQIQENIY